MNHKEILNQVRAENNTEKIEWCYLPADEIYEAMKRAAKQAWINGYNQGIIEESWDTGFSFDDYMLRIAEPTQIAQKNEFVIPAVSVTVCAAPKDYICNVNDGGLCRLPTHCDYQAH